MGNRISINDPPTPGPSSTANANRREGKSPLLPTAANEEENPNGRISESPNMIQFKFDDLKICTQNFKSHTLLGNGVSGEVYKGWIDENTFAPCKSSIGMPIAVIKLYPKYIHGSLDCEQMINFLGRVSHPNLVKFLGYSWDQEHNNLLLVNEFAQRGSLENHLFSRNEPLSWELGIKIAIGAARALYFLHSSENKGAYKGFKTSSILLDGNYNAKLTNFGLTNDENYTASVYDAPESLGRATVKSDVYSFGMVLLELITGLKVFDKNRPREQYFLVYWLRPILSNKQKLKTAMDVQLSGQYSEKAIMLAAQLYSQCVEPKIHQNRPSMKEVVEALEHILEV